MPGEVRRGAKLLHKSACGLQTCEGILRWRFCDGVYADCWHPSSTPRKGAADSIATRIPPSPLGGLEDRRTAGPEDWNFPTTLEVLGRPKHIKFLANWMAGGLLDWRTERVGSIGRIERKTSLQRRNIAESWGPLAELFGDQ